MNCNYTIHGYLFCKENFTNLSKNNINIIIKNTEGIWDSGYKNAIKDVKNNSLNIINVIIHRHSEIINIEKYTKENNILLEKDIVDIEKEGNIAFPTSFQMKHYENKVALLNLFLKCNVKIPKTWYFKSLDNAIENINEIEFPIIIKRPYSCYSRGIMQCLTKDNYIETITNFFKTSDECIIQKKINFTKEARLTYIGDKIFHGYYRIKKNKEQLSGCTKFGSKTSFDIDLKKNENFIKSFVKKTGYDIGGIDVVWEDDNEDTEPYVLEVSPIFDMNPPPPINWNESYKKFKEKPEHNIKKKEEIFKICKHIVDYVKEKYNRPTIYCDIDSTINNHYVRIKKWSENNKINSKAYTYEEIIKDEPLDNAIKSNHLLYDKFNIYFITARKKFPNAYNSTRDWLNKHGFRYDRIILTNNSEDKIKYLKEDNNLKFFIDDCKKNYESNPVLNQSFIDKLKENNIPFVIFDNNWNFITDKIIND